MKSMRLSLEGTTRGGTEGRKEAVTSRERTSWPQKNNSTVLVEMEGWRGGGVVNGPFTLLFGIPSFAFRNE